MARTLCHLLRHNRCLYLLTRYHKYVGAQKVYSMMSRPLFYSLPCLTSVTTGIHSSPSTQVVPGANTWRRRELSAMLAQPQSSAGIAVRKKIRVSRPSGSSNFNISPSSLTHYLRHMPPTLTEGTILTSSVGSYAPTPHFRLDTAMLKFHVDMQGSTSAFETSPSQDTASVVLVILGNGGCYRRQSFLILSLYSRHSQIQWSTSRDVVPVLNYLFKYDRNAEADCSPCVPGKR